MSNDKLEKMLESVKKNAVEPHRSPINTLKKNTSNDEENPNKKEFQEVGDLKSTITLSEEEGKRLGLINKLKANHLKNEKQLQAQEVIFDTQITRLEHQADAIERQSKAYWDARSVDFAEGLKTYAQQNLLLLENARLDNKSKSIVEAFKTAQRRMDEILGMETPDAIKEEILARIISARDATVERIEQDALASKYDLGPDKS